MQFLGLAGSGWARDQLVAGLQRWVAGLGHAGEIPLGRKLGWSSGVSTNRSASNHDISRRPADRRGSECAGSRSPETPGGSSASRRPGHWLPRSPPTRATRPSKTLRSRLSRPRATALRRSYGIARGGMDLHPALPGLDERADLDRDQARVYEHAHAWRRWSERSRSARAALSRSAIVGLVCAHLEKVLARMSSATW